MANDFSDQEEMDDDIESEIDDVEVSRKFESFKCFNQSFRF
jgi:hypothetical protein